jgi:hypothetical protein
MPTNNTLIMMGLGLAALFMLRNRGGSQEDQAPQLAGAAMMASGEGTAPDAPFQQYSPPANPVFFFNTGGQMAKVPGSPVPIRSTADEDIGVYPGGNNRPELEFEVARSVPAPSSSDISPINPVFSGSDQATVTASTIYEQPQEIAEADFMPILAIQDQNGGGINILGSNVDIATLSSKEHFQAVNVDTGFSFHSTGEVLAEYVQGFTGSGPGPSTNATLVSQTEPAWATHADAWWDEG